MLFSYNYWGCGGGGGGGAGGGISSSSNLVFYAKSTFTVIPGRYTFCRYTIIVKNMYMLNIGIYSDFYKQSEEVCKAQTENLFSNIQNTESLLFMNNIEICLTTALSS